MLWGTSCRQKFLIIFSSLDRLNTNTMDKFVVRKPRESTSDNKKPHDKPRMRQSTIESLQGVVVIEEIRRHKSILKLKTSTPEQMVESLCQLGKKIPSRQVMLDTKIGNVVNKLRKHEHEEIRKAARKVYVKWRTHFEEHLERPKIEVKCDLKTENLRSTGRKLLAEALSVKVEDTLPEVIERETFYLHNNLINQQYRRTIRSLVFTLKNNADVRSQVLSAELSIKDFIQTYKK